MAVAGLMGLAIPAWAQTQNTQSQTLPEVLVRGEAEPDDARGTVRRLDAAQLANQGASSMADIVRYQPLVSAPGVASGSNNIWDGSGTTGYNIRGVDGNRVAIDVDGIELPPAENLPDGGKNNSFSTSRDTIEPELYQFVEIESGATASGRSGSLGQGGRVRFVTKSPEDFLSDGRTWFGGYKLGYQSADRSWLHALTGAAQIGQVQALGIYARRDGEHTRSKGNAPINAQNWDSNALLTKFVWGAGTGSRLGLSLEHFQRDTEIDQINRVSTSLPEGAKQDGRNRRTRVSLEHRLAPGGGVAAFDVLESRVYYQRSEARNDTFVPEVAANPRAPRPYSRAIYANSEYDTWGGTLDARKQSGQHGIFYGLALTHTASKRPWEEVRTYLDNGEVQPPTIRDRAASADDTRVTLYARDEIKLPIGPHGARVTPGLTVQHYRIKPKDLERYAQGSEGSAGEARRGSGTLWLPSLNFSIGLSPTFDAYAQYSRGARVPTVSELTGSFENPGTGYAIVGNPDLKKETSDNVELGLRGAPVQGVTLSAAAFYSRYRDFIEYSNIGRDPDLPQFPLFVYRTVNIGKARIWGAELSSRFELGQWAPAVRGLSVSLAGGWSRGRATNAETGASGDLSSVLPAKLVAGLAYDDPGRRFGAALHASWTRSRQADAIDVMNNTAADGEKFRVPSATVLDLTGYWNVARNVTWRVGIYNLTDRKYWDYASVRDLGAADTVDIERQARPGRSLGTSLEVKF
ncbi:TonB-dependent hemoglobin/transferrin/lactoferrin family receptor [Lampropedia cohaerens]|nr:TonB-dependent hemoglobin/transferrin/lactoferrin family receptor [Lampropedia cohaerens]